MKRYRLLNDKDYFLGNEKKPKEFKVGNIFKEYYDIGDNFLVRDAVKDYPEDWELVEEDKVLELIKDNITPCHYKGKTIQPIDLIESMDMSFNQGNVIKYVSRYKDKNGLEDLKKAEWYLQRLIEDENK
jgi:hypothetical protein